ncbi:MAG TPA: TraR/DksA C4-type zinc finger protein [Gemmataceae bacterium]|nr:TraR/DksA C4-type zinc finger protein [Gemmataceae bacterium]
MSPDQLAKYRKALTNLTATVERELAWEKEEVARGKGSGVTAADAAVAVLAADEELLGEAKAALARIDSGTFGACEWCGRAIPATRLDAIPYARRCARCENETPGA